MVDYGNVSILVPTELQGQHSTLLCGSFASSTCAEENRTAYVIVVTRTDPHPIACVGCIANDISDGAGPAPDLLSPSHIRMVWLTLQTHQHISLTSLTILGRPIPLSQVNLVFYNSDEICESELISKKFPFIKDRDHANDVIPYFIHCVQRDKRDQRLRIRKDPLTLLIWVVVRVFLLVFWLPKVTLEALHSHLITHLDYSSASLRQILLRFTQVRRIHEEVWAIKRSLLFGRLIAMIVVDVLAGVAVACVIGGQASVGDMYSSFCSWTKLLAATVHRLLDWLSGAPAGLKLNQPLTQALSAFFSYHVHLWILYLELADPVLRAVAWVLVWVGMCGASVQVAILSDLLDLATLHLHCFYIYGARIYNLQTSLLGSQWRAFRGRKWNPLKQRVDTYDAGGHISLRRVLTAVVFTLVVFLLPTTAIYYLVFVLLRLGLNLARGLLSCIVCLLNINPLYLIFLNFIGSNRVKGDIYFSTVPDSHVENEAKQGEEVVEGQEVGGGAENPDGPLLLSLHTWPSSLSHILTDTGSDIFPPCPSPCWSHILSSIVFADHLL